MYFLLSVFPVNEEEDGDPQRSRETKLQRCKFLFKEALGEDEAGRKHIAVKLYICAAELGLSTVVQTFERMRLTLKKQIYRSWSSRHLFKFFFFFILFVCLFINFIGQALSHKSCR